MIPAAGKLRRCSAAFFFRIFLAVVVLLPSVLLRADDTNSALPVVSVVTVTNATESGSQAGVFAVARTGDTTQPLTVDYQIGGTATNGADYERLSGTVTLAAGESLAQIGVVPIENDREEESQTVTVTLDSRTRPFTLVVLPDTQYYSSESYGGTEAIFTSQTQWIAQHKDELNIAFVLHEGDITDGNSAWEWANAKASLSVLDGVVPYALAVGNHDGLMTAQSQTDPFNQFFPLSQFQNLPTFGGVFESNRMDNCYHLFSAGGVDWLLLSLEFGPRDEVLEWANQVASNYPDRRVILLTHTHVYSDNTLHGSSPNHLWTPKSYRRENNGTDVWEKFLRHHANAAFVFNGHVLNSGTGRLVSVGDYGNQVFQMLANYQTYVFGGAGFLRIVQFFPDQDTMSVRSYSPYLDTWLTTPDQQFTYTNLGVFTNITPGYLVDTQNAGATLVITNDDVDLTPPAIAEISYEGLPPVIRVAFDEPVDQASAETLANYWLDHDVSLTGATLLSDESTVMLELASDLVPGTLYTLAVNHVQDQAIAQNEITIPITNTFVYDHVLLTNDFDEGGLQGWTIVDEGTNDAPSQWVVQAGQLMQLSNIYGPDANATDHRKGTFVYWNDPWALGWSNYALNVTFNSIDDDGVGVLFRYQNRSNYYKVDLDSQRNFRKLFKMVNGVETTVATEAGGYVPGQDYVLRVEATNSAITILLDGNPLFGGTIKDRSLGKGTIGLYSWGSKGVTFDNLGVLPPHLLPLAVIQYPINGAAISSTSVFIAVNAFDPDGCVKAVDLFLGNDYFTTLTNAPFQYFWVDAPPGNYTLTAQATDNSGFIGVSDPVSFRVASTTPEAAIMDQPQDQNVFPGDGVALRVHAAGGQPRSYQWFFNDVPIDGATNAFFIINNAQSGDAGAYAVVVTNAWGAVTSQPAMLTVDVVPEPGGYPNDLPALKVSSLEVLDPGVPLIAVHAMRLNVVNLQGSTNLQDWTPLQTLTNYGEWLYFSDPDAFSRPNRFYRAIGQQ